MAKFLSEDGLRSVWGKIKTNFLPITGGTLTGNLVVNNGAIQAYIGVDRLVGENTHQLRVYPHTNNNSIYFQYLIDNTEQVTLRLLAGTVWTNGNITYKMSSTDHYTDYYDSNNNKIAAIRYNGNDTYNRFMFTHFDSSNNNYYDTYVLPKSETSLTAGKVYDILTTKTITASATELNYCDGVTSSIQTQLNEKVPITRTINSKALSSNITLAASDVGAVPTTRTVNGKVLSSDITLTSADINKKTIASNVAPMSVVSTGVYISEMPGTALVTGDPTYGALLTVGWSADRGFQLSGGKGDRGHLYWRYLDSNSTSDSGVAKVSNWLEIYHAGNKPTASDVGAVPTTRTVNSKALSANITLSASDVSALPISGGILTGTLTSRTIQVRDSIPNEANYIKLSVITVGSTSVNGVALVDIGNQLASGKAGNAYGCLRLWSTNDTFCQLEATTSDVTLASHRKIYLNRVVEVASWDSSSGTLILTT